MIVECGIFTVGVAGQPRADGVQVILRVGQRLLVTCATLAQDVQLLLILLQLLLLTVGGSLVLLTEGRKG